MAGSQGIIASWHDGRCRFEPDPDTEDEENQKKVEDFLAHFRSREPIKRDLHPIDRRLFRFLIDRSISTGDYLA